jgi:Family of unknown function (DUF6084)
VSETLVAPDFDVLGAEPVAHAAAPTLRFALRVTDASERSVAGILLAAQINIDPARRAYDDQTRERLVELFGAPERWAATTRSFLWAQASALVPPFTGTGDFTIAVPCSYDLELAAAKYFYSLPDGDIPLTLHFSGTVLYEGEDGRLQLTMVPWSCSATYRLPVAVWQGLMASYYPGGGWVRLESETLERLAAVKAREGLTSFDAAVRSLIDD